jgi:hypothetical protein
MLSDQVTQLLTAFVDGELSQRQRKAVMRVLHKSSEARELVRQLQENAHKIKQLPRRKLEPSLVDAVMQAIAEQKAMPAQPAAPRIVRRRWLPYVAAAMAASLVIGVVSIFAWRAFKEQEGPKDDGVMAKNGGDKKIEQKATPEPIPQVTPTPTPRKSNPLLGPLVEGTFENFAKLPVASQPFSASFAALNPDKGAKFADLAREINRDPTVHLDITVKSNSIAMDRLKDVLKDRGITLVTDQSAAKTLAGKNQAKVEYLVYAENLSSDELTKLMGELSKSYVLPGTTNQKTVETPYKKVTVAPLAKDDKQKVAKLLGVETMEPKGNPQPEAKRFAVVLPTSAGAQPSAQVRQFVEQRRQPQPGAVQVLIKIHQE